MAGAPAEPPDPAAIAAARREEAHGWAQMYATMDYTQLPWYAPRASPWLVRAVRAGWIKPTAPVLDVGCGAGTNVLWLANRGFLATGLDLAPGAIETARRRAQRRGSSATFEEGSVTSMPFQRGAFGSVVDNGCFHSLPVHERLGYATEVARVLRPGGTLFLTWIGREETGEYGPPHRPSLHEVTGALESEFIFRQTEFADSRSRGAWDARGHPLARYSARLERRRSPQPRVV
jgi:SAM-dependent methyltransferase